MTYKEHILETLFRAYCSFGSAKSGASRSRYKSWEYCHKIFLQMHKKGYNALSEEDFDYLALNLAFFLASWGMYRGSSFLLQRDYKTHIPAVRIIMEEKYGPLWDFDPSTKDVKDAYNLLFRNDTDQNDRGLYFRLEYSYLKKIEKGSFEANPIEIEDKKKTATKEAKPTDTLITKILLATLACIPAFDTFFKKACKEIKPSISDKPIKAFLDLCEFAKRYSWELQFKCKDVYHPPMKVLDLYFWRVELGMSLLSGASNKKKDVSKILISEKYFEDINSFDNSNNKSKDVDFPSGDNWRK